MARKNTPKKTRYSNIYELEMSNGEIHYIANFSHNRKRYPDKNLTNLYGVRTAKKAFAKLIEIRTLLSEGVDVFSNKSKTINYLVDEYLDKCEPDYRKNATATYNAHIKNIIGELKIDKVTKEHLIQIRTAMEKAGLSPSTIKKPKIILSPIFKEAFSDGVIRKNILSSLKFGGDRPKPELVDRIDEPLIDAIRKIYNTTVNYTDDDYKIVMLISIMCTRRLGEIIQIKYEDIYDGVVHVRASTTKTYKNLHPNAVAEKFPLPKEVTDLIEADGNGQIAKFKTRSYMDRYKKMIINDCDLKFKPLAKEYPVRSHDNRNFIMSIQKKKFGKDLVGAACLSHSSRSSNMNDRYDSLEFDDIKEVYEDYWNKLRATDFKNLTKNAIEEAINEVSLETTTLS